MLWDRPCCANIGPRTQHKPAPRRGLSPKTPSPNPSGIDRGRSHSGRASGEIDVIWNGVVHIVLLPVPLMLPVERARVVFLLRDRRIRSARRVRSRSTEIVSEKW